ncbi:hypothetical protein PSCICM_50880 [Pseudomonas cichorii]|nr:hypothetical protein PSCICM_50880 [Pseudomonas cichorii]
MHARTGFEARIDLTRLDTETANFHLAVTTTQMLKAAICTPATAVAGAIKARAFHRAERVSDKCLGGQFGTIQVTQRNTIAADAYFSGNARGYQLLTGIQHIDLGIGQRLADGHIAHLQRHIGHVQSRGVGGGFRRAVAVNQAQIRSNGQQVPEYLRVGPLTATHQNSQPCQGFANQADVLIEHRSGHEQ